MFSAVFGLAGAGFFIFIDDAVDKGSGARVVLFLTGALVCFGIAIAGAQRTPDYLNDCDDYSVFASSC